MFTRNHAGRFVTMLLAVTLASCAGPLNEPSASAGPVDAISASDDCVPTVAASVEPPGDPDRRIEDIIEFLTGERQTSDLDPVEETIADPNFGGVWGDFAGGVVVAVLDCSLVDADTLAEMAGGSASLHLIEVPHTFKEIDAFRDLLVGQLAELDLPGDVFINSTLTGREMEVHVRDLDELPASFGSGVPAGLYHVVESVLVDDN